MDFTNETGITIENKSQALTEVEKFLTLLWEHPLVDMQTRDYRTRGIEGTEKLVASLGINSDDYVAVPYGSIRWSVKSPVESKETAKPSDFDIYLIIKNEQVYKEIWKVNGEVLFEDCVLQFQSALTLDDIKNHTQQVAITPEEMNFLLTPDEYVIGNLDLARQVRIGAINSSNIYPNTDRAWNNKKGYLHTVFYKDFKNWPAVPDERVWAWDPSRGLTMTDVKKESREKWNYQKEHKGRLHRFLDRLRLRAQQTRNPNVFINRFMEAYQNLELPDFSVYKEAILASRGELHIDTNYTAHGVGY